MEQYITIIITFNIVCCMPSILQMIALHKDPQGVNVFKSIKTQSTPTASKSSM